MTEIEDDDVICINQNEHLINNNSFMIKLPFQITI